MAKFEMKYRKTDMRAFFNDILKKNYIRNYIMLYSVIGIVIFMIFFLVGLIADENVFIKPLPFVFIGALIVIAFLTINRAIYKTPEKLYQEFNSLYDGGSVTCTFISDRVYIEDNKEKGYILYSNLEKAVESDNYFYIFINRSSAQIVKKSALVEGSLEDVRKFLQQALGGNYENITKNRRKY